MKNSLKVILMLGLAMMLSSCMTEEERIRDHRVKCEMYGFVPGTSQFAKCVQKKEFRYEDKAAEERRMFEMQVERDRIHHHHRHRHHHHH